MTLRRLNLPVLQRSFWMALMRSPRMDERQISPAVSTGPTPASLVCPLSLSLSRRFGDTCLPVQAPIHLRQRICNRGLTIWGDRRAPPENAGLQSLIFPWVDGQQAHSFESLWASFLSVLLGNSRFEERFGLSVVCKFGRDRGSVVELGVEALVVPPPHTFQGCEFDSRAGRHAPRARISSVL